MAMIDPNGQKKFERDPEEGNIPTGQYLCELSRVQETGPSAKFPGGNNRLVFEFTVVDPACPHLGGKKTVVFLGKTLLKSKEGRESNLVKWARMMGVVNPENGFDPDTLLGRRFMVMCEFAPGTNGEPGRAWARAAMASSGAPAPIAPNGAPIVNPPPASGTPDPNARWDYMNKDGKPVGGATTAELQQYITDNQLAIQNVRVKPAGAPPAQAKTADQWGFLSGDPVPW